MQLRKNFFFVETQKTTFHASDKTNVWENDDDVWLFLIDKV